MATHLLSESSSTSSTSCGNRPNTLSSCRPSTPKELDLHLPKSLFPTFANGMCVTCSHCEKLETHVRRLLQFAACVLLLLSSLFSPFIFHAHFAAIFPHPDVFFAASLLLHSSASSHFFFWDRLPCFLRLLHSPRYRYCFFYTVCRRSPRTWKRELTWKCSNSHKSMKNHREVRKNRETEITWKSKLIEKGSASPTSVYSAFVGIYAMRHGLNHFRAGS